jgi:hypothetical protein
MLRVRETKKRGTSGLAIGVVVPIEKDGDKEDRDVEYERVLLPVVREERRLRLEVLREAMQEDFQKHIWYSYDGGYPLRGYLQRIHKRVGSVLARADTWKLTNAA